MNFVSKQENDVIRLVLESPPGLQYGNPMEVGKEWMQSPAEIMG